MGERAECVPAVIVQGWPDLAFNDTPGQEGFFIPAEEDIFAPLLESFLKFGRRSSRRLLPRIVVVLTIEVRSGCRELRSPRHCADNPRKGRHCEELEATEQSQLAGAPSVELSMTVRPTRILSEQQPTQCRNQGLSAARCEVF
jgi:hypothetical protein